MGKIDFLKYFTFLFAGAILASILVVLFIIFIKKIKEKEKEKACYRFNPDIIWFGWIDPTLRKKREEAAKRILKLKRLRE